MQYNLVLQIIKIFIIILSHKIDLYSNYLINLKSNVKIYKIKIKSQVQPRIKNNFIIINEKFVIL